ncbi:MAG: DNA polymerase III subunit gamma/tau [Bacteroidales bacterium]|nr:DNA polymerase III subunit gamma/tau [Bacteroidales bacterium]
MESFIVSARKYRPATFDMVVGQDTITGTLKNAIRNNYLAQAYLFCGPRGVGKTTCARIFAKTINCSNLNEKTEPCDVCESCVSFNSMRSFNIHELDAASNNKVEDIRTLTDLVRIPPQVGKFSIYIIDEVHMLSSSAFNAFLKTLEEPPSHAVFILATTEKHKIIPTILSRCQIFDFNRIKTDDIVSRLKYVAENEKVSYEEEALHVIATKADGALRDALSIFDQIISYSNGRISYKDVIDNLNLLDYEYYFRIVEASLEGNYSRSLLLFNEVLENGFDGHNFIAGLGSHIRDLLVSRDEATISLLETAPAIRKKYRDQSAICQLKFLFSALEICSACDLAYKTSRNPRLLVEIALFRMASLNQVAFTEESSEKKKIEPAVVQEEKAASLPPDRGNIPTPSRPLPEKERESIVKNTTVSGAKTLSVKDIINNGVSEPDSHTAKEPSTEDSALMRFQPEPFNLENLRKVLTEFARQVYSDSPRISRCLSDHLPESDPDGVFIVKLSSNALKDEFDKKYCHQMGEYLNRRLVDIDLKIDSIVETSEQKESVYYTDEQKFAYLSEKNPALKELRRNLNLDFD